MNAPHPAIDRRLLAVLLASALASVYVLVELPEETPDTQPDPLEGHLHQLLAARPESVNLSLPARASSEPASAQLFSQSATPHQPAKPVMPVAAAPVIMAPPLPPAPQAPPVPFQYLGRMDDGETVTIFLKKNEKNLAVTVGDVIDGSYRVMRADQNGIRILYMPMNEEQWIPVR